MSQSLVYGENTTGNVSFNLASQALDYPAVTAKRSGDSTESLELVNTLTSPDFPEELIVKTQFADPYKGTNVNPAYRIPNLRGLQIMVRDNTFDRIQDSETGAELICPFKSWTVMVIPLHPLVTEAVVAHKLGRNVGLFYQSDRAVSPSAESRIAALMRRALVPTGM